MRYLNFEQAFSEGLGFIRKVWIGLYRLDDTWQGSLDKFYPSLCLANFSKDVLESYLKEAMEGRAWLPKGMYVEYDENNELLITITKEV